jgi:type I restriction enzyme R subunit
LNSALEQKNLALETLRKLLTDQIKISERRNLVQAQKFRAALEKAMLGYTNKQITTAEMIAQLLELAKWVREAKKHGQELGLDSEEVAFYDALGRERIGQRGNEIRHAAADGARAGGDD